MKGQLKTDKGHEATAQTERSLMVDDNIYMFPRAIGPMLIDYYSRLMKEPLPQQLKDQLAMLAEATGSVDLGMPTDAEVREPALPQGTPPEKPK